MPGSGRAGGRPLARLGPRRLSAGMLGGLGRRCEADRQQIAVRAVAKDEQGEPDPQHFERFCHAIVLEMLTDVCHVGTELATQVGDDILARGESYATLDDAARNALISPFAGAAAGYEPAASPLKLKGSVAA